MLTSPEAKAFCVAPAAAPLVAAMLLGVSSPWPLIGLVAYVAAFAVGAPLFVHMRRGGLALALRCFLAAATAGLVLGLLSVIALLVAVSGSSFRPGPATVVAFFGTGAAWGIGLGLIAGAALFGLLRSSFIASSGA